MLLCSANGISAICSILTKNITTRLVRTYRCTRTRRSRVPFRLSVARWRCQYLTQSHCDRPGKGCLFAALGSDVGRQGRAIRRAFREGLGSLVDVLAKVAPGRSSAAKRKHALADMAQMVGAMVLAQIG